MASAYEIENKAGMYFLTFTVVDWVDIFTRKIYRDVITDSFTYCRQQKGLLVFGYVIMSNHVHCILQARNENLSVIIRDFKRHTATTFRKLLHEPTESRRDWMLKRFEFAARSNGRNNDFKFWQRDNHAMEIVSDKFFNQKLNYIHLNPVRAGLVEKCEDWLYSSARNYLYMESVMEIDFGLKEEKRKEE
jgi:REP element-mobilizing transposase RayT